MTQYTNLLFRKECVKYVYSLSNYLAAFTLHELCISLQLLHACMLVYLLVHSMIVLVVMNSCYLSISNPNLLDWEGVAYKSKYCAKFLPDNFLPSKYSSAACVVFKVLTLVWKGAF